MLALRPSIAAHRSPTRQTRAELGPVTLENKGTISCERVAADVSMHS